MQVLSILVAQEFAELLGDYLLEQGAQAVDRSLSDDGESRLTVYADAPALDTLCAATRAWSRQHAQPLRVTRRRVDPGWATRWTQYLEPVQITQRLRLVPSAAASTAPDALHLAPGLVFGFGEHPTTGLAARWIEAHAPGRSVLDIGTGSGVLALIAARAGCRSVWGIDTDAAAVEAARDNARRNALLQCRFTDHELPELEHDFEVVVANIDAMTLIRLAPAIEARLVPGGHLALTGLLDDQATEVARCYHALGLEILPADGREGWVLLSGRRPERP